MRTYYSGQGVLRRGDTNVLPSMRKQKEGLIINVTSGFGRISAPFAAVYAASKFGLEGLSEGLYAELRQLGVDVAILEPGTFPTEMAQKPRYGSDATVNDGYAAIADYGNKMGAAIAGIVEKFKPNPQDVADAVVALIDQPKGQRPLRTVVDPSTGELIRNVNKAVAIEQVKGLEVFGLDGLLA